MEAVKQVQAFVNQKIQKLLNEPSESAVRQSMARLRQGIGHTPGEIPKLWGEYLLELPEELCGKGSPSYAEWAIYISLTMFALHQQSCDRKAKPMHRVGISIGRAANSLIESEEDRERVAKRFYPVATASDMNGLSHHLRSLVTLLRSKDISLDYVQLAADLYWLQIPDAADKVKLRWGEDFCRLKVDSNNNEIKEG